MVFTSCQQEDATSRVIISGNLGNVNADSITLQTNRELKFYDQMDTSEVVQLNEDNTFTATLKLQEGHYVLKAGDVSRSLYLKPGYDIHLNFENSEMEISGKGDKENQYLQDRENLKEKLRGYNSYQYYSQLPEEKFLKSTDSIQALNLKLITEYEGIDERLEATERNWLKLSKTDKLRMYPLARARFVDPTYIPSPVYPDAWEGVDVNDEKLLDVSLFAMLMLTSSGKEANELGMERWEYIISDDYPVKNAKIKQEILYLAGLYTMSSFNNVDEFHAKARSVITNDKKWAVIDQKFKDVTRLEKGWPAPEFELKNMQGKNISLEDLKGNIVYLDFWASWCRPCIEEMPAFKKLQNEFASSNIKFVSIGIESKKESLEKLIKAHGLEGIHLFDPDKEEDLKKRYNVEGIPHYVLIDTDGKMIEKRAKRPSEPTLKTQLSELVN